MTIHAAQWGDKIEDSDSKGVEDLTVSAGSGSGSNGTGPTAMETNGDDDVKAIKKEPTVEPNSATMKDEDDF